MKNYEECRDIAEKRAKAFGATTNKAYKLGNDYVFENADEEFIGVLPMVVSTETGDTSGLWQYLNANDMTMDDMQEIDY